MSQVEVITPVVAWMTRVRVTAEACLTCVSMVWVVGSGLVSQVESIAPVVPVSQVRVAVSVS